jgi:DNA-binding transcriptional LysR family regulator
MSIVSDALRAFADQTPDVQIQIQCDRSDRLLQLLEDGEIDVAFMMDQGRHSLRKFVHSMDLEWVCSRHFLLPKDAPVPLAFLTDGRDLRQYALKALDNSGRRGHVTHLSPHPIGVRSLVQAGLALTVMPRKTIVEPLISTPHSLALPKLSPVALAAYYAPRESLSGTDLLLSQLEDASK